MRRQTSQNYLAFLGVEKLLIYVNIQRFINQEAYTAKYMFI